MKTSACELQAPADATFAKLEYELEQCMYFDIGKDDEEIMVDPIGQVFAIMDEWAAMVAANVELEVYVNFFEWCGGGLPQTLSVSKKLLWMRKSEDITNGEYGSFYKSLFNEREDHFLVRHVSIEDQLKLKAILFVPRNAPDSLSESKMKKHNNIKLYVHHILTIDDCQELMPEWLNFVKGVVDSEDLPLHVSGETLRENKILRVIKKNLTQQCLDMFIEITAKKEDCKKFYKQYSNHLKFGVQEDSTHRTMIAQLMRYQTSKSGEEQISLKEYTDRIG